MVITLALDGLDRADTDIALAVVGAKTRDPQFSFVLCRSRAEDNWNQIFF
jgi:hypothetical protein